jgi:hypothetical protein
MSIDTHLRRAVSMEPGRARGAHSAPIGVGAIVGNVARTGNTTIRATESATWWVNCGRAVRLAGLLYGQNVAVTDDNYAEIMGSIGAVTGRQVTRAACGGHWVDNNIASL